MTGSLTRLAAARTLHKNLTFSVVLTFALALSLLTLALVLIPGSARADTSAQAAPFSQHWSNTDLITTNDDWSRVPGIMGYRGDNLAAEGANPQTVTADGSGTPVNVSANRTNPSSFNAGGLAEFHQTNQLPPDDINPTIAFQGNITASAPHLVLNVNTTGQNNIRVSYTLRDIDGGSNNSVQQMALQYRVGNSGAYTNLPGGYVLDATTGPNLAVLNTPVSVVLPAAADNKPLVQVRIITVNAPGQDEWIGIDSLNVTSATPSIDLNGGGAGTGYSATFTEGGGSVAIVDAAALTVSDADSTTLASATATITNLQDGTAESLSADTAGTLLTANYNSSTGVLTLSGTGTPAQYQQVLRTVRYNNTSKNPNTTARNVNFVVNDGTYTSNTAASTVAVNAVNDAPVNTVPGAQSTNEDSALTFSSANSNLISISDVDAGSNPVKVTLGVTNGKLTLSGTNGLTFTAGSNGTANMTFTGTITNINSALSGLKFDPNQDYNGSAQLTITTDDQGNTGSGGAKSATNTVNITVNPVNDAPSFELQANPDQTVDEDSGAKSVNGFAANISAGPANESGQTVSFLVSNDNNSLFTAGGQPAIDNNGKLTFTPAADANGSATVTVRARDDGGTANGGQDTSAPQTFTITVRPVNDAPSFAKGTDQTVNEDSGQQTVNGWATNISRGPANESSQTVEFLVSNDNNSLFSVQPAISDSGTLTYRPAADAFGTATVSVRIKDSGGTANGGQDTSAPQTFTITVNAVNDAPSFELQASPNQSVDEDSGPQSISDFVSSFSAGPANESGQTVSFVVSNDNNSLFTSGGQPEIGSSGKLTFTPADNAHGSAEVTVRARDDGGTDRGGQDTSAPQTFTITVRPVNDAPLGSDDTRTMEEDGSPIEIDFASLVSDVETSKANLSFNISTPDLTKGSLSGTGSTRTFTPAQNFNGSVSISYTVTDRGDPDNCGEVNSGCDAPKTSAPKSVTINVSAVNDAPVAEDGSATTEEDTSKLITLSANDVDGDALSYRITSLPAHGKLYRGESTAQADEIEGADLPFSLSGGGDQVTYKPDADYNGSDSFEFRANDGTVDSNAATMNIMVSAVNDAPVNTVPGAQSTNEDSALTFSGANGNLISISDVDAGNDTVQVRLEVTNGKLRLGGTSGLSFTAGDNGTSDMTFTGTIASINAALNGLSFEPNADYHGSAQLKITTNDQGNTGSGGALSDIDTVNITVSAINDAPTASDDTKTTPEDQPLTFPAGDLTSNDSPGPNESGQSLSVTGVSDATNGTVSLQNGGITFTPDQNYNGSASFSYTVCDNGSPQECATATVNVNVTAVNDPPVAKNDSYGVSEDDTLNVAAPGVLRNDTDVDGDQLTPEVVSGPRNGRLMLNRDGSFIYVPTANYNGPDSFTYRVSDGNGGSATATVDINVTAVNDPPDAENDQATTDEDTSAIINVKANDSPGPNEADQTLTVTSVTNPPNGEAEVIASGPDAGKVRYTPDANFNGTDTFSYTVCDSGSPQRCATAVVTVVVNSVNDRPVAKDDTGDTVEDTQMALDVLANDTDADGNDTLDPASVRIVREPANGTATVNPDGTITYTPNANYNGRDEFAYTVCDNATPRACSEPATVSMIVEAINDPPRLNDDERTTAEDEPLTFPASELLENDSAGPNEPGQSLTVTQVANANGGTVSLDGGQITFTPRADYNGPASFTYTACDDGEPRKCATAKVNVNITPVNDAPVARDGERATDEDQPLKIQAPGVLFNDTDVDGDRLTASSIERGPQHGRVTLDPDGSFTYTPDENYNGADSFTYRVSDGNGGSDTGEVRITVRPVNDEPDAADDEVTTDEDSPAEVNFLSNDTDVDGDTLTLTDFTQPQNGRVVCAPDGTCTYTPARDYNGEDSFSYRVSDGHAGNVTARVSVTVKGVNDAPQALADAYDTEEDEPLTVNAPGVLGNDTDAEDDPLTSEVVSGPQNGELNFNADGSFTYNPDADFNGTDTFEYRVSDGNGGTDTATVRITVGAANDPPVAVKDVATTDEDRPVDVNVLENDSDPEGDSLRVVSFTQPRFGKVECTPQGICTYTPPPDFNGTDSFTYTVSDGVGGESGTTVTVTIRAVNDAPVAGDSDVFTNEDERLVVDAPGALGNDTDREGDPLSAAVEQEPHHGELSLDPDGSYTYAPDENYNGADSFTYRVSDGSGGSDTGEVRITVRPVNDEPDAADDEATTDEDTSKEIDVLANDTDVDGDALTLTDFAQPEHGTVSCTENGVCDYEPDADYNGDDSFTYKIGDGSGGTASAGVSIAVTGVNDAPNASDDEKTVHEDGTLTFPASDLTANDSAGANEAGQSLTVTEVSGANGATVSLDNGQVIFRPNADYNGPASFTYTACDDGEPRKCATAKVNVNVTAVNDAPENTVPGAQSTDDTATLVFSGENGISISDDSGASGEARVTLSVSDGALSLATTGGLAFAEGDGADDKSMTFSGSISNINAALDGLRYQPGGYHGTATLTVTTNDLGNTGTGGPKSDEDAVEITVRDTTAPDAPGVDLAVGSDTGRSDTDNATSDATPTFGGRAEPNSTVRLYDGETLLVELAADNNGNWAFTIPDADTLSEGEHRITATATDAAGNVSNRSEPLNITVDTTAPDTFIDRSPPNPTNHRDTVRFFSSSEQGASFECSFDGSAFKPCDSPKEYNNLSEGEHTFRVRAVDEAGNTDQSPASRTFVVDTTPPTVNLTAPEDGALVRGEITLSAEVSDENGVRNVVFLIDGQIFDSDMSDPYEPTWDSGTVSDGEHTITVRAYDEAGNEATSETRKIRVDNTAPDTFIGRSPPSTTNQTTVRFEFTSPDEESASFECSLDGGAFEACESGEQYQNLSEGEHTFRVRTVDEAGNTDQSPAERTFVVDTRTPDAPRITSPSNGSRQDSSFTISGTAEPNSTVRLYKGETLVSTVTADENGDWSVALASVSDGSHTYTARSTDRAGNTSADSEPLALSIDTVAPDTVITSSPSNPTKSASAAFGFRSTEENSTFECKLDGGAYEPCEPGKEYTGLSDGEHVFRVRAVDAAGNVDRSPASRTFVVDTRAPDAPEISTPAEGSTDNDGDITISGTAEPGSRVELLENGKVVGTATTDEAGNWRTDLTDVGDGSHAYTARATDEAGNTSAPSGERTINVDSGAPEVTRVVPAEDATGVPININVEAVLSEPIDESTLDGGNFTLVKEGSNEPVPARVGYDPATGWITLNPDSDLDFESVYTATIKSGPSGVKDRGGNPLAQDRIWRFTTAQTPDTRAPDAPDVDLAAGSDTGRSDTDNTTRDTAPVITGNAEPGSRVELFSNGNPIGATSADESGNYSFRFPEPLSQGTYRITATATDAAGNTSPASDALEITVDTTPADTFITTSPDALTNQTTVSFEFTSPDEENVTFECSFDGGPFVACNSPKEYTGLSEGEHVFRARSVDIAGNLDRSPAERRFTVDTRAPSAPEITSPPDGARRGSSFTLSGKAEPNSTVRLYEGGDLVRTTTADENGDWSVSLTGVSDGAHPYTARATDAAGNASGVSGELTVNVDTGAPDTIITSSPPSTTNQSRVRFAFTSPDEENVSFECSLDGGEFVPCESGEQYPLDSNLSEGEHTFRVRAVDEADNADPSPASRTFTVDTEAPTVRLTSPPDGALVRDEITIGAEASDNIGVRRTEFVIDILVNGRVVDSDRSFPYETTWDSNLVPDGEHTITVRVYDEAGNVAESETHKIRVDNTAPDTTVRRSPDDLTNGRTASFLFESPDEENVSFECSLDGGAFEACENGKQYQNLSDGEYVFRVRAVDEAGNRDASPAERRFVIDASAPEPPEILSPAEGSTDSDGNFTVSGSAEPGSTVKLYEGEELVGRTVADEAGNWSVDLRNVSEGAHTYRATATDAAGNVSDRSEALVVAVDRMIDTGITSGPSGIVKTDTVRFGFTSTEAGATFECSLDGGPFERCEFPKEYAGLSKGTHTFQVRAIGPAGNVDQTPAGRTFTVDLLDPLVVRDDLGSTGEAAAVSNSFISQYASTASAPTRLYQLDTAQRPYGFIQVGANIAYRINAIGYRSTDNSLYGYRMAGSLGIMKINPKTGAARYLGIPRGLPANSYVAGDVSPNGSTYYLYANKSGVLWKVNLTTFRASSVKLSSAISVADLAVSPTDGNLYGVARDGRLVRVDPRTGQVTASSVAGLRPGAYGAAWFTAEGDLIAYENGRSLAGGTMTWIARPTTAPSVISQQPGPSTDGNDGAAYVAPPNPAGLSVVVDVLANDGDPDGALDPNTLRIVEQPANGTVSINADKTITYTSGSSYRGTDSFRYEVCDNDAPRQCATATVNITSAPVTGSSASRNE